ncbi:hypothetical protein KKF34_05730 [Myxococcota bacterium]|nr:hypothetical protein [Myxococcota bacterium]MBU1380248.1 hypothetical protein [Myxococcota bacterium]MBU1496362.1 hypothetical protein [Myxococcota bacterium]
MWKFIILWSLVFGLPVSSCMNVSDYLETGNFEKAARHCNAAKLSEQSECWFEMGKAAESIEKYSEALEYYRLAKNPASTIRIQTKMVDSVLARGDIIHAAALLTKFGQTEKALKLYEKIADSFFNKNDLKSALKYYELARLPHKKAQVESLVSQKEIPPRGQYKMLTLRLLLNGWTKTDLEVFCKTHCTSLETQLKNSEELNRIAELMHMAAFRKPLYAIQLFKEKYPFYSRVLMKTSEALEKQKKFLLSGYAAGASGDFTRASRLFGLSLDKDRDFGKPMFFLANTDKREFKRRASLYRKLKLSNEKKYLETLESLIDNKRLIINYAFYVPEIPTQKSKFQSFLSSRNKKILAIISSIKGKYIKNKNVVIKSSVIQFKKPGLTRGSVNNNENEQNKGKVEGSHIFISLLAKVHYVKNTVSFLVSIRVGPYKVLGSFWSGPFALDNAPKNDSQGRKIPPLKKASALDELAKLIADYPNLTVFRPWLELKKLHAENPEKKR